MVRPPLAALLTLLLGTAAAHAQTRCPGGRINVDLGLTSFDCTACGMRTHGGSAEMVFGAEPRMNAPRPGGPADGKVRAGDALVAVDGLLITTSAGARRLAQASPGKPLQLTLRRAGKEIGVKLVPAARCVQGRGAPVLAAASPAAPSSCMPAPSPASPRGRLGVALAFGACSRSGRAGGGWAFETAPEVTAVRPGGPAARAGVQPGDRILEVDGFSVLTFEGGRRLGALKPGEPVRLTIGRQGERRVLEIVAAW